MSNPNCCRDKGYFDKWNKLKERLNSVIYHNAIFDITAENNDIIKRYSAVVKTMEEMEETASK